MEQEAWLAVGGLPEDGRLSIKQARSRTKSTTRAPAAARLPPPRATSEPPAPAALFGSPTPLQPRQQPVRGW